MATWTAEETQLLPVPASELVVGLAALVLIVLVVALVVWLIRRSANRSDTPT